MKASLSVPTASELFADFVYEKVGPTAASRSYQHSPGRQAFVKLYVQAWTSTLATDKVDFALLGKVANRANKLYDKFESSLMELN
jgi:hypothetical protein